MIGVAEVPAEYLQLTDCDSAVGPLVEIPGSSFEPSRVALSAMTTALPFLIRQAGDTAGRWSDSYRGFRVGAAALAYSAGHSVMAIMTGANIKPSPDSPINIHAETMAIAKARHWQVPNIYAMAVWGPTQPDQQSGIASPTLHMCGLCRAMAASPDTPEISDRTLIVSGNADFSVAELYTVPEIVAYHAAPEAERQPLTTIRLDDEALDANERHRLLTGTLFDTWARIYHDDPFAATIRG